MRSRTTPDYLAPEEIVIFSPAKTHNRHNRPLDTESAIGSSPAHRTTGTASSTRVEMYRTAEESLWESGEIEEIVLDIARLVAAAGLIAIEWFLTGGSL